MKIIYSFFIVLLIISCSDKAKNLEVPVLTTAPVNSSSIILTLVKDNIEADGAAYAELVIKAGPSVTAKFREVNLELSPIGKFSNGNTTLKTVLDVNGESRVFISGTTTGLATVKAVIGEYSTTQAIHFISAWPDQLKIEPDSSQFASRMGNKSTIKATGSRINGQVTGGYVVQFYDSTTATPGRGSVGIFLNSSVANATGVATAEYAIQDTSYHGYIYIIGYTETGTKKITGMNRILRL